MKGLKWVPIGESGNEAVETGEHFRELVNVIVAGDELCGRCGLFFQNSAEGDC